MESTFLVATARSMAASGKLDVTYNRFCLLEYQCHNLQRLRRVILDHPEISSAINSVLLLRETASGALLCDFTARYIIVSKNLSFGPPEESITPLHAEKPWWKRRKDVRETIYPRATKAKHRTVPKEQINFFYSRRSIALKHF